MSELSANQLKELQNQFDVTATDPLDQKPKGWKKYTDVKIPISDRLTTAQAMQILQRDRNADPTHPFTTTYLGVPILQEHSIRVMARKILMYVQFKQFCAISNVGKSGGGKTTFSGNLVHEIHLIAEKEFKKTYTIMWVGKEELAHFDEWLKTLPHVNLIMIFEDVSYSMEIANKKNKLKIKEAFTHIRHELGDVEVLCIFHYHYTRAFDKMMRDSYYSIYTTLGKEEKGNLIHMHGGDFTTVDMLNKFAYRLKGMDELGYFTIPLDKKDDSKKYVYWTQNPFQIALTDQHGDFHFTMYASPKTSNSVSCQLCSPTHKNTQRLDAGAIFQAGAESFSLSEIKKVARFWLYMRGGQNCLKNNERRIWDWLDSASREYYLNPPEFAKYVNGENVTGHYGKYRKERKKNTENRTKRAVMKMIGKGFRAKEVTQGMELIFNENKDNTS